MLFNGEEVLITDEFRMFLKNPPLQSDYIYTVRRSCLETVTFGKCNALVG